MLITFQINREARLGLTHHRRKEEGGSENVVIAEDGTFGSPRE